MPAKVLRRMLNPVIRLAYSERGNRRRRVNGANFCREQRVEMRRAVRGNRQSNARVSTGFYVFPEREDPLRISHANSPIIGFARGSACSDWLRLCP